MSRKTLQLLRFLVLILNRRMSFAGAPVIDLDSALERLYSIDQVLLVVSGDSATTSIVLVTQGTRTSHASFLVVMLTEA